MIHHSKALRVISELHIILGRRRDAGGAPGTLEDLSVYKTGPQQSSQDAVDTGHQQRDDNGGVAPQDAAAPDDRHLTDWLER